MAARLAEHVVPIGGVERIARAEVLDVRNVAKLERPFGAPQLRLSSGSLPEGSPGSERCAVGRRASDFRVGSRSLSRRFTFASPTSLSADSGALPWADCSFASIVAVRCLLWMRKKPIGVDLVVFGSFIPSCPVETSVM